MILSRPSVIILAWWHMPGTSCAKRRLKNLFRFLMKLMTLSKAEFLRRFAQHILPRGFMKIRSYGIFGNYRRKTRLAKIREQNCFATPKVEPTSLVRWVYQQLKIPMGICPCCKSGKLVMVDIVYKGKHEDAISWMRSDKMMQ